MNKFVIPEVAAGGYPGSNFSWIPARALLAQGLAGMTS
jgi:hypothetical protein